LNIESRKSKIGGVRVVLSMLVLILVSCGSSERFRIRQFHLRTDEVADGNEFIRAEMNKRLYGAVTKRERELRKGHFYAVRWNNLSGTRPVKIVFEYRQLSTGATVKRKSKTLPASVEGRAEFRITGDDYYENGRVLAWRMTLFDGTEVVSRKQSFLWE